MHTHQSYRKRNKHTYIHTYRECNLDKPPGTKKRKKSYDLEKSRRLREKYLIKIFIYLELVLNEANESFDVIDVLVFGDC
jgi:hypothetical protein